jgi:hypothetical protein
MKYYINYSDESFELQQNFALMAARVRGGFDSTLGFQKEDIDKEFYKKNRSILDQVRGGGYWLWKPYFINKKLSELNYGDYLFYSDSGVFFLKSVDILIDELNGEYQDIMGFEVPLIESQWTKKELFINMECNKKKFSNSNHLLASYILIKKTNMSEEFFDEYLKYSCDAINITDKYNNNIKQNKDFIEHRHDQSIFSLLYKKYNLKPFKEPTQYGEHPYLYSQISTNNLEKNKLYTFDNGRKFRFYQYNEKYKNVLFHNRKENPLISLIKFKIKEALSLVG